MFGLGIVSLRIPNSQNKKKLLALLILVPLLGMTACTTSQKEEKVSNTGYSTPESEGISSKAILQFVEALEEAQPDALHSVMLRRHGKIVAEGWWAPYNPDSPHLLWSLSKSFTSTAIGMAQDEGLLSIDDQVISFFPEDTPEEPGNNLKSMRISDLLRMNTGHEQEPGFRQMQEDNRVKAFLIPQKDPGFYNSLFFSYNRPELITGPLRVNPRQWIRKSRNN